MTFVPISRPANDVVVDLGARRKLMAELKASARQLDELQRAKGHLIQAWRIFVAEHGSVPEARSRISVALIEIMSEPVTKQE
jgi:hypothetical protein